MIKTSLLLVIEGTYPWYRGGVSEWVYRYLVNLDEFDFYILQIATDEFEGYPLEQALYPIPSNVKRFIRVPTPQAPVPHVDALQQWRRKIDSRLEQLPDSLDAVHVANTGFAGWLGAQVANRHKLPLVLTEHALYWKEVETGAVALECGYKIPEDSEGKRKLVQTFKELAETVYRAADLTVSVSRCNLSCQEAMGAGPLEYIPNGVPESWLCTEKRKQEPFTVGWIGRCAAMKNPLRFIQIAESFLERDPYRVSFLMLTCDAGEPKLAQEVNNVTSQYDEITVRWNENSIDHIDKMDSLCITSCNESQPLVMLEASARQVLPFGWRVGDVDEELALVFPGETSTSTIARTILDLWHDPEAWNRETQRRYERVAGGHTWPHIFNQYRNLFFQMGIPEREPLLN